MEAWRVLTKNFSNSNIYADCLPWGKVNERGGEAGSRGDAG